MSLTHREEIPVLLDVMKLTGIGVELGVRHADFTTVIGKSRLKEVVGIDSWSGTWSDRAYRKALKAVGGMDHVRLVRMDFGVASDLFEDGSLDFVYVDGNASSPVDEQIDRLETWYSKLRTGGLFAGHDYCKEWPNVMEAVEQFMDGRRFAVSEEKVSPPLHRRDRKVSDDWGRYPSWFHVKGEM